MSAILIAVCIGLASNPGGNEGVDLHEKGDAPLAVPGAPRPQRPADGIDFFEKKIRPVLVEHCYRCHSASARRLKGGLLLDTRAAVLKGGDSGPVLASGKPEESRLLRALRYEDPDLEMPPAGKLPDAVIEDFTRWIAMGAPDPRDGGPGGGTSPSAAPEAVRDGVEFWAFVPPRRTTPPVVEDASWPRGAIDRFVLARLEAAGLRPVAGASRRALARRLHFDLIGLPPSPEALEAFAADESPGALPLLVDSLLASPHFGERWGRHWLDVARYSDSTGGGRTRALANAWRYRDYVIETFNRDKPFDRFIREQVAGDLLPHRSFEEAREQLIATGFLVLGPHNYENQDKDLLRMDVVDEQIDTAGRAFLGLTLGCARCHDHKFDPIPARDYYALAGIFRSTKTLTPGNVSGFVERPLPVTGALAAALEAHEQAVSKRNSRLASVKKELAELRKRGPLSREPLLGIVVDDAEAELTGEWKSSTYHPRFVGKGYIHDDNKGKGEKRAVFRPELPAAGLYEVRISSTPGESRAANVPVTLEHAGGTASLRVDQRPVPPIDALFIPLGRFELAKGRAASVTISNEGTNGYVIVDAVQFIPVEILERDGKPAVEERRPEADLAARARELEAEEKRLQSELKELQAKGPERPMAIAVRDEEETGDWHIHIRGGIRSLGETVPRGFLSAIANAPPPAIARGESGRRELAEWIASPENPLTARVIANRVWNWLFGEGLARTTDNFGRMGEEPSHPEILDYLALRLVERGWSLKALIREIVLSRTYALSTEDDPRARAADPENRLLWRANRRRLDAESIRDAILVASGALDLTAGGPTIERAPESMAGDKVEYGYRFTTRRRSVYVPVFRNTPLELFEVFDFADPNLVTGSRTVTTRPTQGLYILNSPFILEQSRLAAERLLAEPGLDDGARLDLACRRVLGRPVRAAEKALALEYLTGAAADDEDTAATDRRERWAGLVQALFGSIDFRFLE